MSVSYSHFDLKSLCDSLHSARGTHSVSVENSNGRCLIHHLARISLLFWFRQRPVLDPFLLRCQCSSNTRGSQGFPGTGQIAYDPSRHGADELEAMVFSMAGTVTVFSPTKKTSMTIWFTIWFNYKVFKIVMVHIIGLNPRKQTHQTLVFHDQSSSRKISKDHKPLK